MFLIPGAIVTFVKASLEFHPPAFSPSVYLTGFIAYYSACFFHKCSKAALNMYLLSVPSRVGFIQAVPSRLDKPSYPCPCIQQQPPPCRQRDLSKMQVYSGLPHGLRSFSGSGPLQGKDQDLGQFG